MTVFSCEKVKKAFGNPPVIHGRPTWTSLWALKQYLIDALRTLKYRKHPKEGFAPYLRTNAKQALISSIPWEEPVITAEYFTPSQEALIERQIAAEEGKFKYDKEIREGFEEIDAQLVQIFTNCIDSAYHTGADRLGQKGFGNLSARKIIFRLFHLYGKPTLTEIEAAEARLAAPMDRNAPVEVMLRGIEEVQMFYLHDEKLGLEMKAMQMITKALIKLKNTGLYAKAIEKWNQREADDGTTWSDFRAFMIEQFEKMLRNNEGPTVGDQGYGAAFNAVAAGDAHAADDTSVGDDSTGTIIASVTKYAERATAAEAELSDVRDALSTLQHQFAALMTGQLAAPGIAAPVSTIHVGKKRKTPQQGVFQPPPAPAFNVNQALGWQQPQTPMGSYGQAQWSLPPQATQQPTMNHGGQQRGDGGIPFSNTRKEFPNLFYCFTCGYDVDHPGAQCPYAGPGHIPNVNRDEAHLVPGASMKAQHKVLPDGSGAGKGWIQAQGVNKAFYTMAQQGQQPWAQIYQQRGGGGGGRGRGYGRGRGRGRGGWGRGRGGRNSGNGGRGGRGAGYWHWGANNTQQWSQY